MRRILFISFVFIFLPLIFLLEILVDPNDFSVKTVETDFSFKNFFKLIRIYDFSNEMGVFGRGWKWNLDSYVKKPFENFLEIKIGDNLYKFLKISGLYKCLKDKDITALETGKGFLMVFPDGFSYFFDRAGRIRNITYQESSLTIQYENDKVIKIEDEQGNALSIFYNSDGFIEQIICPDGTRLIYEYENGLLT